MEGKKVLKIVLKSIDEKALCEAVIAELIEPAVNEFVKDTENKYDDMLAALLLPKMKELIPAFVAKLAQEAEEAV